jgi:hypothetical protein
MLRKAGNQIHQLLPLSCKRRRAFGIESFNLDQVRTRCEHTISTGEDYAITTTEDRVGVKNFQQLIQNFFGERAPSLRSIEKHYERAVSIFDNDGLGGFLGAHSFKYSREE